MESSLWHETFDLIVEACAHDAPPSPSFPPNSVKVCLQQENRPVNSHHLRRVSSTELAAIYGGGDLLGIIESTPSTSSGFVEMDPSMFSPLNDKTFRKGMSSSAGALSPIVTPATSMGYYKSSSDSSTNCQTIFSPSAFDLPPANSPRSHFNPNTVFNNPNQTSQRSNEMRMQTWTPAPHAEATAAPASSMQSASASTFYSDHGVFDGGMDPTATVADTIDESTIQRYLEILNHSSSCFDKRCPLQECFKMRAFIAHVSTCAKAGAGCRLCKRFFLLAKLHSTTCGRPVGHCSVLFCSHFKLEAANV